MVIVEEGSPVELGCLAHGHPLPSTTWYRHSTSEQLTTNGHHYFGTSSTKGPNFGGDDSSSARYHILPNSLLIEKTSSVEDGGVYRCFVNNSLGSEVAETTLVVKGKLDNKLNA